MERMKSFDWDAAKNELLKQEREISFEDVVIAIEEECLLDILVHPHPQRAHQKILVVAINEYAYLVPFVEDDERVFLKTIIPSRKATKQYIIKSK